MRAIFSFRQFQAAILTAVLVGAYGPGLRAVPQQPAGEDRKSRTHEMIEEAFNEVEMREQFGRSRDEIRAGGEDPLVGKGYPTENHPEGDKFTDVLKVAYLDNPMVTETCRRNAARRVFEGADSPEKRRMFKDHLVAEITNWDKVRAGQVEVPLSQFLDHLHKCKDACGPLMSRLLECHIDGVSKRPHMIVFFDVGRPKSYEEDGFTFEDSEARDLREFARKSLEEGLGLMLLSRASILHLSENPLRNVEVATRRADVVERVLVDVGVPPSRIMKKVLTWEPPRLESQGVAAAYGFDEDWKRFANPHFMDQSVVLVGYRN